MPQATNFLRLAFPVFLLLLFVPVTTAQWVQFGDETSTRLVASSTLGSGDVQEKDYAWADLDQDGDIDLVCVRKQPVTSAGRYPNVLFMNENGVLTDRSAQFASASNVSGSQGFLDATNDRDVAIADVDGDGWLDMITAVTLSGSQPKYISHPRIYINLGNDALGNWQGFIFDDENRTPTMPAEPRFCSVSVGDIDGDGDVDFYMGDYEQGGSRPIDVEDRLFINDGTGYFSDESSARMSVVMLESSFAMSTQMVDMNADGKLDIIKDDALNAPQGISISYNNTSTNGFFSSYEFAYNFTPYHVAIGDLNNDGKPDLVATDDGSDRYILNQGNGSDGLADFGPASTFQFTGGGGDDGFGGNNLIVDLNNDGWNDVIITDVDVDIAGCNRRTHIYRNLGDAPDVTLQEEQQNGAVVGIPTSMLSGTHDAAVFDINGDGWKDMVLGRCTGTQVWMNQPPIGVVFSYPQGLPYFVAPGTNHTLQVRVVPVGSTTMNTSSGVLRYRTNGGGFTSVAMTHTGGNDYQAVLPVSSSCTDVMEFYVSINEAGGTTFSDPSGAPSNLYEVIASLGTTITHQDGFENGNNGWTVTNDPSLTGGGWELAEPNATFFVSLPAAPGEDGESSVQSTHCWVTENGPLGAAVEANDVDGGPTILTSPAFDFAGTDATLSYRRWFLGLGALDSLVTEISGDGNTWVPVETLNLLNNSWQTSSFRVSDYITPSVTTYVRFRVEDFSPNSVVEAAIDLFQVEEFDCGTCQQNIGFQGPGGLALEMCGGDLSVGTSANVKLTGANPFTIAIVFATNNLSPTPVGSAIAITTAPLIMLNVPTDASGTWTSPAVVGGSGPLTLYVQAAYFDAGLPFGFGLSNGLQVDFLP